MLEFIIKKLKQIIIFTISLAFFLTCSASNNRLAFNTIVKTITQDELTSMLSYLASDELEGRRAGERGCELAADFIRNEFESYGLEKGINDLSYYQDFVFYKTKEISISDETKFSVRTGYEEFELNVEKDYIPIGISPDAGFEGELAFVGYGMITDEYNDYENIDVEGKAVIIMYLSPYGKDYRDKSFSVSRKTDNAIKNGAKAMIWVEGSLYCEEDNLAYLRYYSKRNEFEVPILHISQKGLNKILALKNLELSQIQKGINESKKPNSFILEDTTISINVKLKEGAEIERTTNNIIGYLPGNNPNLKDEVIVIGAHYDHIGYDINVESEDNIYNGANDNASGTVAMLEIAEALSMIRDKINRTIVFIGFSAEELGLIGSKHYVENPIFPIDNTVLMFNYDMLGSLREENSFMYAHSVMYDTFCNVIYTICKKYYFDIKCKGVGNSDHIPFKDKDIPTIYLHTPKTENLHQVTDDLTNINFEGLTEVTKYALELVLTFDAMNEIPIEED